jgi:hypothetical protein
MDNYFGFEMFDGARNGIGGKYSNPYFKCGENNVDQWTKYYGYIGGTNVRNEQCYDNKVLHGAHESSSYGIDGNVRYSLLRFGSCYANGNSNGVTYYAFPAVRELTGH